MFYLLIFILLLHQCSARQGQVHSVYWNSSNPEFETFGNAIDSPGYYEIGANPMDVVKFHCPKRTDQEFSLIYQVSYDDFLHCILSEDAQLVGGCKKANSNVVVRRTVEPSAGDSSIYFISTSTGKMDGLHSRRLGLCLEKNVRLAVSFGPVQLEPASEGLFEMNVDQKRLAAENLYLAEENGALNWKKNVHPAIEKQLDQEMTEKRKNFESSRQYEPVPIDQEFVYRLEEYKRRAESNHVSSEYSDDVQKSGNLLWRFSSIMLLFVLCYY